MELHLLITWVKCSDYFRNIESLRTTAQDAGIYSYAELDQFWNRVLFAKHSDTTLQLLGKSLSYDFITVHNEQHFHIGSNPYNQIRIGL